MRNLGTICLETHSTVQQDKHQFQKSAKGFRLLDNFFIKSFFVDTVSKNEKICILERLGMGIIT